MPTPAKRYALGVIGIGGLVLAAALWNWASPNPQFFAVYLVLTLIASTLKFRLPGIAGTYSVSFLFTLIGIVAFTLPETLIATCAGALIQSVWKAKQRPRVIQLLFNMANLCPSIRLGFLVAGGAAALGLGVYRPAVLALIAAVYFFTSTMVVSGVLSRLEGQPLRQVCQQWYLWSFPYYLVGAAVVGLLPLPGHVPALEGWLILVPLLYLVHFFYAISTDRSPKGIQGNEGSHTGLTFTARLYANAVIALSLVLVCYGAPLGATRLRWVFGYLTMALLAAMLKVRLPGLTSTDCLQFCLHGPERIGRILRVSSVVGLLGELTSRARSCRDASAVRRQHSHGRRNHVFSRVQETTQDLATVLFLVPSLLPGTSLRRRAHDQWD